jgi:hypothetical protein
MRVYRVRYKSTRVQEYEKTEYKSQERRATGDGLKVAFGKDEDTMSMASPPMHLFLVISV